MDMDIALFDDTAGPQTRHQFVFAHHLALCRGQGTQDIQHPAVQLYRLAVAPQFGASKIEPKRAEADLLANHPPRPSPSADPTAIARGVWGSSGSWRPGPRQR